MTSHSFAAAGTARSPAPDGSSRAAEVAAVHLGPINESRKRCGLLPLAADELAREFADVDRLPVRTKGAPAKAAPQNGASQAAADAMWSGIVAKLNASPPSRRAPIEARLTSSEKAERPIQTEVDWGPIAANLNAEAGLRPPARNRGRHD